ncbi:MAG: hypothetical protein KatS3mg094_473 [Candidatus Parcubacteria bacterium]|nr:MAG: hypothetical protein KatS3mg094_473 [Candidatus Parcubacteria bacterium]
MKIINKSFSIIELIVAFFIILIFLGTLSNSYLAIINSYVINQRQLAGLQNLKTALDRIYLEIKTGGYFSTTTNELEFLNINDCVTTTLIFTTTSDDIGYLSLIKNNITSNLSDINLIDIDKFNIYLGGKINTSIPTRDIITNNDTYNLISAKSITIAIEGKVKLKGKNQIPINIQMTAHPFNSFNKTNLCRT